LNAPEQPETFPAWSTASAWNEVVVFAVTLTPGNEKTPAGAVPVAVGTPVQFVL